MTGRHGPHVICSAPSSTAPLAHNASLNESDSLSIGILQVSRRLPPFYGDPLNIRPARVVRPPTG
jgi:hypothetical protein